MNVLFTVWGYKVTVIELASVFSALLSIGLCINGTRWAWPLYFLSSLLYGWLFLEVDLFASAATQLIFMAAAVWGWFSWGQAGVRMPGRLTPAVRVGGTTGVLVLWAPVALLLQSIHDASPCWDAFMLVGSLAGQLLMVRQKTEAWPVWIAVNAVGAVLYTSQGLYFTALFYSVLIIMAVTGWRTWSARADGDVTSSPAPTHA